MLCKTMFQNLLQKRRQLSSGAFLASAPTLLDTTVPQALLLSPPPIVSSLRKRHRDDDDNDVSQPPPPRSVINIDEESEEEDVERYVKMSRNVMQDENLVREGLMLHPNSKRLHGVSVLSVVTRSVSSRIRTTVSAVKQLKSGLDDIKWSLSFLRAEDKNKIIFLLAKRDQELVTVFDEYLQSSRAACAGKTNDEIAALVVQQSEVIRNRISQLIDGKKVAMEEKALKLGIISPPSFELGKLDSAKECVVCFDMPKQICAVPCGHISMCNTCASRVDTCPICLAKMTQKVQFIVS